MLYVFTHEDKAEPLLLAGYEVMMQREKTIPEQALDKMDDAAKWRKELEASKKQADLPKADSSR